MIVERGIIVCQHSTARFESATHSKVLNAYFIILQLAVNSWGPEWGEQGLFRILRGVNESGIEEHVLAVRPEFNVNRRRRRRRRRHGQLHRRNKKRDSA